MIQIYYYNVGEDTVLRHCSDSKSEPEAIEVAKRNAANYDGRVFVVVKKIGYARRWGVDWTPY